MPGHELHFPYQPKQERKENGQFARGNNCYDPEHLKKYRFKAKDKHGKRLPIGSKTIRQHHRKKYWFIKVSDNNWMKLHVQLWLDNKGKIPNGSVVRFKDGDTLNCELDNLYLCSRKTISKENVNYKKRRDNKRINELREIYGIGKRKKTS